MSIPDINQVMAQVGLFLQNPQAFEKMLESLNLPEEQKLQLRGLFNQFSSGALKPDPNLIMMIGQMLSNLSQSGLPPQMGNLESFLEMMKNKPGDK
ncbi:MAG: hypothetical protein HPY50_16510 [Firmicutes bacterium]|nr:hypothetical protein [Bacillota bacterium]